MPEYFLNKNCAFVCKAIRNSRVTAFKCQLQYYQILVCFARPIYPCWNSPPRVAAQQQQHKWIKWCHSRFALGLACCCFAVSCSLVGCQLWWPERDIEFISSSVHEFASSQVDEFMSSRFHEDWARTNDLMSLWVHEFMSLGPALFLKNAASGDPKSRDNMWNMSALTSYIISS